MVYFVDGSSFRKKGFGSRKPAMAVPDLLKEVGGERCSAFQRWKRSNWVERLLELRTDWRHKQKNDDDAESEEDNIEGCDEHECKVSYDDEEEDEGEMKSIERKTFSNMLRRVSSSDIMILSRLAFLFHMAYVIPEIKDSMAIAAHQKFQENRSLLPRPSVAYEIAASAASYVQSRAKDLLSHDTSSLQPPRRGDWSQSCQERELEESSSTSSEMAAYVAAASAVTQ